MTKEKKQFTPEEHTKMDYIRVKKNLKLLSLIKGMNKEQEDKLIRPLFRLYLKATGKFTPKQTTNP